MSKTLPNQLNSIETVLHKHCRHARLAEVVASEICMQTNETVAQLRRREFLLAGSGTGVLASSSKSLVRQN